MYLFKLLFIKECEVKAVLTSSLIFDHYNFKSYFTIFSDTLMPPKPASHSTTEVTPTNVGAKHKSKAAAKAEVAHDKKTKATPKGKY